MSGEKSTGAVFVKLLLVMLHNPGHNNGPVTVSREAQWCAGNLQYEKKYLSERFLNYHMQVFQQGVTEYIWHQKKIKGQ